MSENAFKFDIANEIGDNYSMYNITSYNSANIKKFKDSWGCNFFKKLKEDVPEMKAKRIIKDVYFEMTPTQKKIYELLVQEELHTLEEEYDEITWKLLFSRFHLLCDVFNNPKLLANKQFSDDVLNKMITKWKPENDPKYIGLKEKLEDYIEERNEKVVVFDYRPETLDMLYEGFKKYNPQIIHGSLKGIKDKDLDRKNKEDVFNNDDSCKVIFLSALTSSAGINLQKSCHRVIVYSMPMDGVQLRQLMDRTHRINSVEDTILEIFYYPETIDNIRVQRNLNRIDLNDSMGRVLTQHDLHRLLCGITR
jgi:SNF2 family DNA or RNA helicase